MTVAFTKDIETGRMENSRAKWDLYSGTSIVKAVRTAKEMGWGENKVQVRYETLDDETEMYYVEPYEKDCGCRGILKYKDYY